MIGLDTNVLVRFVMQDDERQSPIATQLIGSLSSQNPGYISTVVLIEMVWVLRSSFGVAKLPLQAILIRILSNAAFSVENTQAIRHALQAYFPASGELTDCLIASLARHAGCACTYTFDRHAARDAGMVLLA